MALIGSRRSLLKRRGAGGRSYADWQAQLGVLATNGSRAWTATPTNGVYRTGGTSGVGTMAGSSAGSRFLTVTDNPALSRVVQHACKDQATWDALIAGGFEVLVQITDAGQLTGEDYLDGVSRNGYTSQFAVGTFGPFPMSRLTRFIRWDDVLKKAFESNPSTGSLTETEYTWP